jgi:hypothetical protein
MTESAYKFTLDGDYSGIGELIDDGECVSYSEAFGGPQPPELQFECEDTIWIVDDQYCMNPSCRCKDIFLTFIDIDPSSETARPAFGIRVALGGSLMKIERVEKWFQRAKIQGIVDCFSRKIAGKRDFFRERATAMKQKGREILEMREQQAPRAGLGTAKPGRNDPCPCGSGKKYKKCCGR